MFRLFKRNKSQSLQVSELDRFIGKVNLIDIREPYEYKTGSIKTAKNIPMDALLREPDKYLQKDKTYYIMCQSGMRSTKTAKALKVKGYQVINVLGGMSSYNGINKE